MAGTSRAPGPDREKVPLPWPVPRRGARSPGGSCSCSGPGLQGRDDQGLRGPGSGRVNHRDLVALAHLPCGGLGGGLARDMPQVVPVMSPTAIPDRFTTLPDVHALQVTVVAMVEHGLSVTLARALDAARQAVLASMPEGL